jgi:hypothetical protein
LADTLRTSFTSSDLGRALWFAGVLACEDECHVFPHSGAAGAPTEANLVPRQVVINRSVLSADKQNNLFQQLLELLYITLLELH